MKGGGEREFKKKVRGKESIKEEREGEEKGKVWYTMKNEMCHKLNENWHVK